MSCGKLSWDPRQRRNLVHELSDVVLARPTRTSGLQAVCHVSSRGGACPGLSVCVRVCVSVCVQESRTMYILLLLIYICLNLPTRTYASALARSLAHSPTAPTNRCRSFHGCPDLYHRVADYMPALRTRQVRLQRVRHQSLRGLPTGFCRSAASKFKLLRLQPRTIC